jgi:hypothetical protein
VFGLTILGFAAAFTIAFYLGPIINRVTGAGAGGVRCRAGSEDPPRCLTSTS